MSIEYLYTWILVLLRATGLIFLLPQLAGQAVPINLRVALSVCLATVVAGVVPTAPLPPDAWHMAFAGASEVCLGLTFGFTVNLIFAAVEMAGRIISSEISLSAPHGINAPTVASEPLPAFLSALATVLFFLFGAHLTVISAFARSFTLAHPGHAAFDAGAPELLIQLTAHMLELGLRIAAPFIGLNFLVTLAFAVLGRAVPRMNVFILSFPVRGLLGLSLLGASGALFARYIFPEFADLPFRLLQFLPAR